MNFSIQSPIPTRVLLAMLMIATVNTCNAFALGHCYVLSTLRNEEMMQQLMDNARALSRRREVLLAGTRGSGEQKSNEDNERNDRILHELVRVKLEKDHKRSFLKSRPWKLPYEDARRWVQANLGADNQADFEDLVENGNLRTPYIPKNPQEYYSTTNDWISWDHFLHGLFDSDSDREPPSGVKPATGVFD